MNAHSTRFYLIRYISMHDLLTLFRFLVLCCTYLVDVQLPRLQGLLHCHITYYANTWP